MEIPLELKKGNAVRIHQKYDKQNVKNYRPVSLLPIYVMRCDTWTPNL